MIRIEHVCKTYGKTRALHGVSLSAEAGKVIAIVGPNGSGKTTLIKSILGLVKPESGTITVFDNDVSRGDDYRAAIGYMPQIARFPDNLSVESAIAFVKSLRGNPSDCDERLIEALELRPHFKKPLRALSGGTRQKVSAVLAFLFRPKAIILDEPTAGLDPLASSRLKDHINEAKASGAIVILTSHIMSEIEELSDSIAYLLDGSILFHQPVAEVTGGGERNLERSIARILATQKERQ